jgi:hypothetical protein
LTDVGYSAAGQRLLTRYGNGAEQSLAVQPGEPPGDVIAGLVAVPRDARQARMRTASAYDDASA